MVENPRSPNFNMLLGGDFEEKIHKSLSSTNEEIPGS